MNFELRDDSKDLLLCETCNEVPSVELLKNDFDILLESKCKCGQKTTILDETNLFTDHKSKKCIICKSTMRGYYLPYCEECNGYLCYPCKCYHLLRGKHSITFQNSFPKSLCKIHSKIIYKFCNKCNVPLCRQCIKDHDKHPTLNLNELFDEEKNKNLREELVAHYNKYIDNVTKVKENMIEKLMRNFDYINAAYDFSINSNKDILNFVSLLLSNHEKYAKDNNYTAISNVLNNTKLNYSIFAVDHFYNMLDQKNYYFDIMRDNLFIKIKNNTINCRYLQECKELNYHSQKINQIIELADGRICSCSEDKTIRLYNRDTYELDSVIDNEEESVLNIVQVDNGNLVSCGTTEIKVWKENEDSFECVHSQKSNKENVKMIKMKNGFIAVAKKQEIEIYNFEDFNRTNVISLLETRINLITYEIVSIDELDDGRIVSSTMDHINIWNMLTCTVEKIIENLSCSSVNGLCHYKNEKIIIIETHTNTIVIVNVKTCQIESCIILKNQAYKMLTLFMWNDSSFFVGGEDALISEFKIRTLEEKNKNLLIGNTLDKKIMSCITMIDNRRIAVSVDKTIVIYK